MDRKPRDRTQAAPFVERFPLFRSAEFDPPRMMYDAAVAIGFAPRTSLSQKSNLRDRQGGGRHGGGMLSAPLATHVAYGFDRKSGLPVSKSIAFSFDCCL